MFYHHQKQDRVCPLCAILQLNFPDDETLLRKQAYHILYAPCEVSIAVVCIGGAIFFYQNLIIFNDVIRNRLDTGEHPSNATHPARGLEDPDSLMGGLIYRQIFQ